MRRSVAPTLITGLLCTWVGCAPPAAPRETSSRAQTVARSTTTRLPTPSGSLVTPTEPSEPPDWAPGLDPGFAVKDHTPLCHYLERGIDDWKSGQRNRYVVSPPGVTSLAAIHHLTLGLDKPYTKCEANLRSIPCSDKDVTTDWCVEKLELFVGSKKLFERSEPGGCTFIVGGGKGGMRTVGGAELRAHELWGWTIDELKDLIDMARPKPGGGMELEPPAVVFGADYLSLTLEGVIGEYLARSNKGCANDLYCDQRRGWFGQDDGGPLAFFSREDKVNCDQGGCPSKSERRSSPWVELRGVANKELQIDLDIEMANSTTDPDDCDKEPWNWKCGNDYAYLARGSVEFNLGFPCTEQARVDVDGKTHTLPYCKTGDEPTCFKLDVLPHLPGTVQCKGDGLGGKLCGKSAVLKSSVFEQSVALAGAPSFDAEGGFLVGLIDLMCPLFLGPFAQVAGCSADAIGTRAITDTLDTTLFNQALFENLAGCPKLAVASDGRVSFDFRELDQCPPGAQHPACSPGGSYKNPGDSDEGQSGFGRVGSITTVAPSGPSFTVAPPAPSGPLVAAIAPSSTLSFVTEVEAAAHAPALTLGVSRVGAAPKRLKPYEVDQLLVNVCAVQRHCEDDFDLRPTLAKLSNAELEALATNGIAAMSPATAEKLRADAAFMNACVATVQTFTPGNPFSELPALMAWGQAVGAEVAKTDAGSCKAKTPGIESLLPVPGLTIAITTADHSVSDQFAFINVRKDDHPDDIPSATRAQHQCAHIKDSYLPPANPPTCHDGLDENGVPCGTVVDGPCADLRDSDWPLPDLIDDEAHPNGDQSPLLRCGWHEGTNRPMTCVGKQYNGAGGGVFPVCKICGVPGANDPSDYTMQGCPVEWSGNGSECPQDYALGADGKCWSVHKARPSWECEANCKSLYGSYGYCFHNGDWRSFWEDHSPVVNQAMNEAKQAGVLYAAPICAEWVSCPLDGVSCAAKGLACSNDQCVPECTSNQSCDPNVGYPLKYPAGFTCSAQQTCRL